MRLAWLSPLPPVRSGVADCSADLLPRLRQHVDIDVFTASPAAAHPACRSAHDFVWLHRRHPYDLVVHQLGNSAHHAWQWPYLFRYPGLVVLHDVQLHHARAASLLQAGRAAEYRAEFRACHPAVNPDLAELAVAGFDNHLYYNWPMTRLVVQAARLTAVHSRRLEELLRAEVPDARIEPIRLGHGKALSAEATKRAREFVRSARGIAEGTVVFGFFGALAPEKRLRAVLAAFARTRMQVPGLHLLLAGAPVPHYDLAADIRRHRLDDLVTVTGFLETEDELTEHIAACDVAINLRWPSAREISGPWLRALAAGRATMVTHLRHLTDVPALDPRNWEPCGGTPSAAEPMCVAIDLLDEDHSLGLAMRRLARDAPLRRALGEAGRRYWTAEHSVEVMVDDYLRLLPRAATAPAPAAALPDHLHDDGGRRLRELLEPFGLRPF